MTDAWARSISPADAAVALRSYPRRWRALLARAEDEDQPEGVLRREPPDGGPSVLGHLGATVGALTEAGGDLRVEGAPGDDVDALDRVATALAAAVDGVDADAWARPTSGGGTLLDVVRRAVVAGSEHLRDAERTFDQVVGRPAGA